MRIYANIHKIIDIQPFQHLFLLNFLQVLKLQNKYLYIFSSSKVTLTKFFGTFIQSQLSLHTSSGDATSQLHVVFLHPGVADGSLVASSVQQLYCFFYGHRRLVVFDCNVLVHNDLLCLQQIALPLCVFLEWRKQLQRQCKRVE